MKYYTIAGRDWTLARLRWHLVEIFLFAVLWLGNTMWKDGENNIAPSGLPVVDNLSFYNNVALSGLNGRGVFALISFGKSA